MLRPEKVSIFTRARPDDGACSNTLDSPIAETASNAFGLGKPLEKSGGWLKLLISEEEFDSLHFAVGLVATMSRDALKAWEAGFAEDGADG